MTNMTRLAGLALAVSSVSISQAQFYKLGGVDTPTSVNNNGVVAGYDSQQYFTWTSGGGKVGHGGAIPGNGNGGTPRISEDGKTLGGTSYNTQTGLSEIASCDLTTDNWTTFGSLGASSGSSASSGFGMTADGKTLTGNAWVNAGNANAIVVNNGVLTDLGTSVAGRSSRADAISDDGSLIGGYQDQFDGYRAAAVWQNGVQTVLMNGADPLGQVNDVSGDGNWAVGGGNYALNGSAYKWNKNTGLVELDNPFAADGWSMTATATNFDGSVVVGYAEDFFFDRRGWIWTQQTGTMAMEDYASTLSGYSGEYLLGPTEISANGRYITGWGYNATGFGSLGWVIETPAVPEPCSLLALGLGGLAVLRRRRK